MRLGDFAEGAMEGMGTTNPVLSHAAPEELQQLVRLSVQIGRHNPIETVPQFGDMGLNGGFWNSRHDEDCDGSAEPFVSETLRMTFVNGSFKRFVVLFKTKFFCVRFNQPEPYEFSLASRWLSLAGQ